MLFIRQHLEDGLLNIYIVSSRLTALAEIEWPT